VITLSLFAVLGPLALLAVGAALLFRRLPGVASTLCLLGFSVALVASIGSNILSARVIRAIPNDSGGQMVLLERFSAAAAAATLAHIAFWLGALALVWVINQLPRPNKSLERTREG
jgi:hypothetical protein